MTLGQCLNLTGGIEEVGTPLGFSRHSFSSSSFVPSRPPVAYSDPPYLSSSPFPLSLVQLPFAFPPSLAFVWHLSANVLPQRALDWKICNDLSMTDESFDPIPGAKRFNATDLDQELASYFYADCPSVNQARAIFQVSLFLFLSSSLSLFSLSLPFSFPFPFLHLSAHGRRLLPSHPPVALPVLPDACGHLWLVLFRDDVS